MKKRFITGSGILVSVMIAALLLPGCPQTTAAPADSGPETPADAAAEEPGAAEDEQAEADSDTEQETAGSPVITGFAFTAAGGLAQGAPEAAAGAVAGAFGSPSGGTGPFTYALVKGNGTEDADNYNFEIDGTKLKVKSVDLFYSVCRVYAQINDSKGKTFAKALKIPVYANAASAALWTGAAGASPGDLFSAGSTVIDSKSPPPDPDTGISSWNIPERVTLELTSGILHMHILYNSVGQGIFKISNPSGNAIMLPGAAPASGSYQVSTLEIRGTLWLVTGLERISGGMYSPGGIVLIRPGANVLFGEDGHEAVTVSDTGGGAYFHTYVKNLVTGSSTVTIKDAAAFQTVTVTENAAYGGAAADAFTMDSAAMGLGSSGGRLVINAPGKTVTVKRIDCTGLAALTVEAGTLAVTDAGGITNSAGTAITAPGGAITVNGVPL